MKILFVTKQDYHGVPNLSLIHIYGYVDEIKDRKF